MNVVETKDLYLVEDAMSWVESIQTISYVLKQVFLGVVLLAMFIILSCQLLTIYTIKRGNELYTKKFKNELYLNTQKKFT